MVLHSRATKIRTGILLRLSSKYLNSRYTHQIFNIIDTEHLISCRSFNHEYDDSVRDYANVFQSEKMPCRRKESMHKRQSSNFSIVQLAENTAKVYLNILQYMHFYIITISTKMKHAT